MSEGRAPTKKTHRSRRLGTEVYRNVQPPVPPSLFLLPPSPYGIPRVSDSPAEEVIEFSPPIVTNTVVSLQPPVPVETARGDTVVYPTVNKVRHAVQRLSRGVDPVRPAVAAAPSVGAGGQTGGFDPV